MFLRRSLCGFILMCLASLPLASRSEAQVAGKSAENNLSIATGGQCPAVVVVAADAGPWEKRAAEDLVHYIEQMVGAKPALANTPDAITAALKGSEPLLIVGQTALAANSNLSAALIKVVKPNPVLRSDAIVVKHEGNRVYLAGNNDDSHYYAVADLLQRWGCRWYMPTEIGECIPQHSSLAVGQLDVAYTPPFEVRKYWLSWIGDTAGKPEFMHRNFFNEVYVPSGHRLAKYTKELIPPGKTMFNVPISEDSTAQHVAKQLMTDFADGKDIMLGLEDGLYESDSAEDKKLTNLQYDKYFLTQSYTDAFLTFYNKVAAQLLSAYPQSKSRIGFLIYSNITIPPVQVKKAAKPLVAYLAPIDIDPIHAMDDPRSAPAGELKDMLYQWADVMEGRMIIYDYDQSMLVWRDIPNPSHAMFRKNVKHYQKAGILGVDTECRGAMATTFTNLYLRGQLLWNPDADVDALLAEFFEKFYGPAAEPMANYWNAIFKSWEDTYATEHEYFVAPAIYTPQLMAKLQTSIAAAEMAVKPLEKQQSTRAKQFVDRMRFTRLGYEVLAAYMTMVHQAATEVDYAAAVAAGDAGLAAREQLTAMNGTFTTYKSIGERGYAWWPGEVQQYRELIPFVDGSKGQLVAKTPLVWNFRRDVQNVGVQQGWEKQPVDLKWWKEQPEPLSVASRQSNPGQWEQLRSDLYLQAQGLITKDFQSYSGHGWYQADLTLDAGQSQGNLHLRFPGLFNECWLYINGEQVAHREFKGVWWLNDYRFEWDADVAGKLKAGNNSIVLRINNPHHFGGMFRRPFIYRATGG